MKDELLKKFLDVRQYTEGLCKNLHPEDYLIQGMEDVSPPKWHLAHTTWFFETFILKNHDLNYKVFHPSFNYLFNSYYQGIGHPFPRAQRGLLSRPLVKEVYAYRQYVNEFILKLLNKSSSEQLSQLKPLIILGIEHEQQHQELLLMDLKYNFFLHPDFPVYKESHVVKKEAVSIPCRFIEAPGGLITIGYNGQGFCFDNELPSHQVILNPFAMASKLVTNQEYLDFIDDGGYSMPALWLSDGWDWVVNNKINSPLYWHRFDGEWYQFSLRGLHPIHITEPVSHISFFEADAFARWKNCRLPLEEEWEYFVDYAQINSSKGNFMEQKLFHPQAASSNHPAGEQFFGDLWEWTSSSYSSYPGYKPLPGNLGEYNGKFMNNQRVLRGGSCVSPHEHIRKSYRNFFQPDKRWPFTGIRLAKD